MYRKKEDIRWGSWLELPKRPEYPLNEWVWFRCADGFSNIGWGTALRWGGDEWDEERIVEFRLREDHPVYRQKFEGLQNNPLFGTF